MIQVTPQMRVFVATAPADFRRGIDGMARVVREVLSRDPFSGAVFVFRNRRATAVKILVYDGQGFWLCHKRLSRGRFRFWPKANRTAARLAAAELQVLVFGGDPARAKTALEWRTIAR